MVIQFISYSVLRIELSLGALKPQVSVSWHRAQSDTTEREHKNAEVGKTAS